MAEDVYKSVVVVRETQQTQNMCITLILYNVNPLTAGAAYIRVFIFY